MSIEEFIKQLPHDVRNLPQIQAMANLIRGQSSLLQEKDKQIADLKKIIDKLKSETSLKEEK